MIELHFDGLKVTASGHAGFAPRGQDIVCAGVSTLLAAAAETAARMRRDGLLEECTVRLEPGDAEIAMKPTPEGSAKAEAVMEMLTAGAELLEDAYGQYVVIYRADTDSRLKIP